MTLARDTRGSAGTGLNFLLALGAGALLAFVLRVMALPFVSRIRAETTDPTALTAASYTETAITFWPAVILLTAFFYLIGASLIERRVGL